MRRSAPRRPFPRPDASSEELLIPVFASRCLGGAQIDGTAAINLVRADGKRFPGSFGSAFMYPMVKGTILFREEHSRRTLVPRVEFVSARGEPKALLTGKALFSWQKGRFRLESVHER